MVKKCLEAHSWIELTHGGVMMGGEYLDALRTGKLIPNSNWECWTLVRISFPTSD